MTALAYFIEAGAYFYIIKQLKIGSFVRRIYTGTRLCPKKYRPGSLPERFIMANADNFDTVFIFSINRKREYQAAQARVW
jgi:hypothetical protein